MQNIGGENAGDAFYRYKMPKLVAKVGGCVVLLSAHEQYSSRGGIFCSAHQLGASHASSCATPPLFRRARALINTHPSLPPQPKTQPTQNKD